MTNAEKFAEMFGTDLQRQCSIESWWDQEFVPPVNPAEKVGHWIPVSERLPEEDGQYLITVKYKPEADYEDIYAEHGEWTDGHWDMFCFGHCGEVEDIMAWMSLPEPYKASSTGAEGSE